MKPNTNYLIQGKTNEPDLCIFAMHLSDRKTRKAKAWLAVCGLVLLVLHLSGCVSAPLDASTYNPITDYPAVGDRPWHL